MYKTSFFPFKAKKYMNMWTPHCPVVGLFLGFQTMTRKCRFVRLVHVIKSRPSEILHIEVSRQTGREYYCKNTYTSHSLGKGQMQNCPEVVYDMYAT